MKLKSIIVLSIIFLAAVAHGDNYGPKGRRFGAGIIAGEPSGITLKGYLTPKLALDAIASWSFVDNAITLIGDVTYDIFEIPVQTSKITLPFYVGAGGKVAFRSKRKNRRRTIVGVRVPIGVAAQWTAYPVEVFFEVGPGIEIVPSTRFDITGGIGVRYYFF